MLNIVWCVIVADSLAPVEEVGFPGIMGALLEFAWWLLWKQQG